MIREIRIYFALRPYISKLKEQTKMKFSFNVFVQILGTIAQGANQVSGFVPDQYKAPVALGVGALQAVTALLAHFSNPNGTPAAVAYVPSPKA